MLNTKSETLNSKQTINYKSQIPNTAFIVYGLEFV